MPSTMPDRLEPMPISPGFSITRQGRSGELAAIGAEAPNATQDRAFTTAGAAPRTAHCARIVFHDLGLDDSPQTAHADPHTLTSWGSYARSSLCCLSVVGSEATSTRPPCSRSASVPCVKVAILIAHGPVQMETVALAHVPILSASHNGSNGR